MPRGPRSQPAHPAQPRALEGINDRALQLANLVLRKMELVAKLSAELLEDEIRNHQFVVGEHVLEELSTYGGRNRLGPPKFALSAKSAGPSSRSLRTHSVGGPEILARVGDECTIGGMVDGLYRRDSFDELGVVAVDVLDQFGLGIRRTGDQYCASAANCTDHVLKEGVIFGGMPAADRVSLMMNVSSGMLRMHDDLVNIRRVEMKHPRFMVIDPDGRVIVVLQDVLRNGNLQGTSQSRPTVQTKYAPRSAYLGSTPDAPMPFGRCAARRPSMRHFPGPGGAAM
jgi:hypothetical protein